MAMQSQSKIFQARKGFLLIELMVALLLVSVFTYIIAYYQSMSIQTGYEAIERWKAANALSSFFAQATVDPTILQKTITQEDGYSFSCERLPIKVAMPPVLKKQKKISYYNVTVTWDGYAKKKYSYQCVGGVMM